METKNPLKQNWAILLLLVVIFYVLLSIKGYPIRLLRRESIQKMPNQQRRELALKEEKPSRQVSRELSDEEVSVPPDYYYLEVELGTPRAVRFYSPKKYPKIFWHVGDNFETEHYGYKYNNRGKCVVDSKDCMWFSYGDTQYHYFLTKINPDGMKAWDITPSNWISDIEPVLVMNGGVICIVAISDENSDHVKDMCYFECFDLDGKSVWRSDYFEVKYPFYSFYNNNDSLILNRIPGNRFVCTIYNNSFIAISKIFSLKNGEMLGDNSFFNWDNKGPFFLDDGRYLGITHDEKNNDFYGFLTCFKPDKSISWKSDLKLGCDSELMLAANDSLICNSTSDFYHRISSVDTNSGKIQWSYNPKSFHTKLVGITSNNQCIISDYYRRNEGRDIDILFQEVRFYVTLFSELDSEGKVIRSIKHDDDFQKCKTFVIYNDESILMASDSRITLFNMYGNPYWSFNIVNLGIPCDVHIDGILLYPISDNRIIAIAMAGWQNYFFMLGQ